MRIVPDLAEGWHTYTIRKGEPLRGWWGLYTRMHAWWQARASRAGRARGGLAGPGVDS